jgi:hypothetical protein
LPTILFVLAGVACALGLGFVLAEALYYYQTEVASGNIEGPLHFLVHNTMLTRPLSRVLISLFTISENQK